MSRPLLTIAARSGVRDALRKKGYSLIESVRLAAAVDDTTIDAAQTQLEASEQSTLVKAEESGLLARIVAFLKSPAGQSLIAAILALLML